MPEPISGAIAGGAVLGAIGANKASKRAEKAQGKATKVAERSADAQLEFAKEQDAREEEKYQYDLARFERIYGGIEENLGRFYGALTADEVAGVEISELDKEFKQAKVSLQQNIEQRGIQRSGVALKLNQEQDINKAEATAKIKGDAKFKLADIQSGFIRGSAAPSVPGRATTLRALTNAGNISTNAAQNEANLAANNASNLWNASGSLLSTGLNYYGKYGGGSSVPIATGGSAPSARFATTPPPVTPPKVIAT